MSYTIDRNGVPIISGVTGFLFSIPFSFSNAQVIGHFDKATAICHFSISRFGKDKFPRYSELVGVGGATIRMHLDDPNETKSLTLNGFTSKYPLSDHDVEWAQTVWIFQGCADPGCGIEYTTESTFDFRASLTDQIDRYYWNAELAFGGETAPLARAFEVYDWTSRSYQRIFAYGPVCSANSSLLRWLLPHLSPLDQNGHPTAGGVLTQLELRDHRRLVDHDQEPGTAQFFGGDVVQAANAIGAVFVAQGTLASLSAHKLRRLVLPVETLANVQMAETQRDVLLMPDYEFAPFPAVDAMVPADRRSKLAPQAQNLREIEGIVVGGLGVRPQEPIFL
jgi:hypothetical protein